MASAGFLAVALATASALVAPDQRGRAPAELLSGTTVAIIAGGRRGGAGHRAGRASRLLGDHPRRTFPRPSVSCKGFPRTNTSEQGHATSPGLLTELAQLARPRLILVMVLAALVNAATFGPFTFLAPIVTDTARLAELWVSVVLVLFGLVALLGVRIAGRLSDRRPGQLVAVGGPLVLLGWIELAALAVHPLALPVLVLVQGVFSCPGQHPDRPDGTRGIRRSHHGGSYATTALNLGATGCPVVAAAPSKPVSENLAQSGPAPSSSRSR
nr:MULTISPECIES: hypothetical protein [unclassified Actinopolyspora]